ncbi:MAG: hypothetical protein CMK09_11500 [Ponticaulis sp.]|nr:hypothetical protein [Ponticaulis sp.]|tara:strand:+ start:12331 stop:13059 length:729 start_codon:yes stop_codon:yes gene_type:complete
MSNIVNNETLEAKVSSIAKLADSWVVTELRAANTKLYSLLTSCMNLCEEIQDNHAYRIELNELLKKENVRLNGQASMRAKVVRLCFPSLKTRWSAYTRVLEAANSAGIGSAELAEWIENEGGIEAIRLGAKPSSDDNGDKYTPLANEKLRSIRTPVKISLGDQSSRHNCDVVVLGHVNSDGTVELYEAVANERLVNEFKMELGKTLFEREDANRTVQTHKQQRKVISKPTEPATESKDEQAA